MARSIFSLPLSNLAKVGSFSCSFFLSLCFCVWSFLFEFSCFPFDRSHPNCVFVPRFDNVDVLFERSRHDFFAFVAKGRLVLGRRRRERGGKRRVTDAQLDVRSLIFTLEGVNSVKRKDMTTKKEKKERKKRK